MIMQVKQPVMPLLERQLPIKEGFNVAEDNWQLHDDDSGVDVPMDDMEVSASCSRGSRQSTEQGSRADDWQWYDPCDFDVSSLVTAQGGGDDDNDMYDDELLTTKQAEKR